MKGRNGSTIFLPLNMNIGGQTVQNNYAHKKKKYISDEQARHVYKNMESSGTIDTNTLKQETEGEQELSKLDDASGDINT